MRRSAPTMICGLAILLSFGCDGGGTDPSDAGAPDSSRTDGGGAIGADSGPATLDGGPATLDGGGLDGGPGPACVPTSGATMVDAYCDTFELAIFDDGPSSIEARLRGRLRPDGLDDDGCAVVDSVEVQEGGVTIGMLSGVGAFSRAGQTAPLARGEALPEMVNRCGGDENRFGGFGFIVRGRMDGGSFEARCADAEGGGRWPPALVVTCHENIDEPPSFRGGYARVEGYGPGLTFTSFDVFMPHGPGGAITSADGTIRVIPHADPWSGDPVPGPFDITGLEASVSEVGTSSQPSSQLSFSVMGDPLGVEVCPMRDPDPDPIDPGFAPPVMLLRFTGTGERGGYRSEAFVEYCDRIPPRPMP